MLHCADVAPGCVRILAGERVERPGGAVAGADAVVELDLLAVLQDGGVRAAHALAVARHDVGVDELMARCGPELRIATDDAEHLGRPGEDGGGRVLRPGADPGDPLADSSSSCRAFSRARSASLRSVISMANDPSAVTWPCSSSTGQRTIRGGKPAPPSGCSTLMSTLIGSPLLSSTSSKTCI